MNTCMEKIKLSDFLPYQKDTENSTILSLDFEKGLPEGMRLPKGYQCGWDFGENGNGGLILQRKPGEDYVYSSLQVDGLKQGCVYRFKASVKLSGIRSKDGKFLENNDVQTIGFDFHDAQNKYLCSTYFTVHVQNGKCDWTHIEGTFTMDAVKASLVFFLKECSCEACQWDNITIKLASKADVVIYPILPKMLKVDEKGIVKMRTALLDCDQGEQDFVLFAILPDGKEFAAPLNDSFSIFQFGQLTEGVTNVKFKLGDKKTMKIVAETEYPFQYTTATPPEGAVAMDESGRVSIDGKPFFPLGIFWEDVSMMQPDIDRMKSMGVNCVLPYLSFRFHLPEKTAPDNTSIAEIRRSMDILHANGIKLIFCMLDVYGHHGDVKKFEGVEGMDNIIRVVVNGLKDHPALLGWYISDENPLDEMPMLLKMRLLISELDPFHPVFTLTYIPLHFVFYGPTGDVFMSDKYPIRDETTQSMKDIRLCLETANQDARLGLWWLPQIFNWGIYQCPHTGQPYSDTRYPTEEEMRSHNLLALNHRARAVIPYAYNSIATQEKYDPGSSKIRWPLISNVLRLTRELEPFYVATAESVELYKKMVGESMVEARLHTADDSKQIIVITSDGPGEVKTVIHIGKSGLKSRFGHTKDLGDGTYEFTAINTASDILEFQEPKA